MILNLAWDATMALSATLLVASFVATARGNPERGLRLNSLALVVFIGTGIIDVLAHNWTTAVIAAVCTLAWGSGWWRDRRKRKRAAAMLGAKSRALRDALVRKVRESAKPRPVLRPAPGGAR